MQYSYHLGSPTTGGAYHITGRVLLMMDRHCDNQNELNPFGFQANPDDANEPWTWHFTHAGEPQTANCVAWADYGYAFSLEFDTPVPAFTETIQFSPPGSDQHFFLGEQPVQRMYLGQIPVRAAYLGNLQVLG